MADAIRHKGEMFISSTWKMIRPIIRNILVVCCNYIGGIYSPAKGHVEAGKGHIIKRRYGVVVVVSIFHLSIYLLDKMVAYVGLLCY